MRTDGLGVADALKDGHLALVIELFEGGHGRVEAYMVVHGQHLVWLHFQRWAIVHIEWVAVRDEGVQSVVGP